MDSYIICTTPRSGSTLLCELLTATGVAGAPDSFFMDDVDPRWAREWGLPPPASAGEPGHAAAHLAAARRAGTAQTGIFGARLMHRNLVRLMAMIEQVHPGLETDGQRLRAAFGKTLCIHLSRADKLAQAVSLVRARQTGLWHIGPDGSEVERLAPPQAPRYDRERIARAMAELEQQDAAWQAWIKAQGIACLRIRYETLATAPGQTVARICRALCVSPPAPKALEPGVARMADALSRDWKRRFREGEGAGR
ncbi:MAG: sulfotransferase [Pararhodobacter sp.]|nr:sulfotransferase [Pararhodobacter sp.]